MIELDKIDRSILKMIQEDAKTDIKIIASRLGMTKTPVYERIRRMERTGLISKYVAIVNRKMLPASMVVFCYVSLEVQKLKQLEDFEKAVSQIPEVTQCYLLGGAHDFLLKVIVKDLDAYHRFSAGIIAALPNVQQIRSSFVLNEIKHSTVIPQSIY